MKHFFILCILTLLFSGAVSEGLAMEKEVLLKFENGDVIYRIEDTVVIDFLDKRDVLSSSLFNGGWRNDLQAVLNHHPAKEQEAMTVEGYFANMNRLCKKLGYDAAGKVSTMGTGVPMKNIAIKQAAYEGIRVTAVVTAGAEGNPGRVGDKAVYNAIAKEKLPRPGTINIMLYFNCDMPPGILARALVTATEAKTAALQELILGSRYSSGLATGTGTDQILAISDPQAKLMISDCGKHTKPGELLGQVVKAAVKEALYKQNGFDGKKMHDVIRRMERFGMSRNRLMEDYRTNYDEKLSDKNFEQALYNLNLNGEILTLTSLYAHLLDQYDWGLLSQKEIDSAGSLLLKKMAGDLRFKQLEQHEEIVPFVRNWEQVYLALLDEEVKRCSKS